MNKEAAEGTSVYLKDKHGCVFAKTQLRHMHKAIVVGGKFYVQAWLGRGDVFYEEVSVHQMKKSDLEPQRFKP